MIPSVSRSDIVLACKLLLGRAPEAAEAAALASLPDLDALRDRLIHADEFTARLPADVAQLPLDLPALDLQWRTAPAMEAALLARVKAFWTRLGEIRPHWSVNARDEFMPDRIAEHMESFRESGRADVRLLLAVLARHRLSPEQFDHVCDFGCGTGRVTLPLAERFRRVTACDISESHLHIARVALGEHGLRNVLFSLVGDAELGMSAPFDLWYSRLVLQHNPPPIAVLVLRRMFGLLAPGGVAAFQLPTYFTGYRFDAAAYLAAPFALTALEYHPLPQPVVFALADEAGCVPLEVREDGAVWPPTRWISNFFLFRKRAAR